VTGAELPFDAFCQRLLSLFDEGRFTATYKYAVLIGLLDVLAERVDRQGRAPTVVHTRDLAGAVLELYGPIRDDLSRPTRCSRRIAAARPRS
jgi:hypothetical protein